MTTSDKAQLHGTHDIIREMLEDPQLAARVHEAANEIQKIIRATWPKSIGDEPAKSTDKFETCAERVFTLTDERFQDGRPVTFLNINHPYAAAHQAKTGAITKSAKAAGYRIGGK